MKKDEDGLIYGRDECIYENGRLLKYYEESFEDQGYVILGSTTLKWENDNIIQVVYQNGSGGLRGDLFYSYDNKKNPYKVIGKDLFLSGKSFLSYSNNNPVVIRDYIESGPDNLVIHSYFYTYDENDYPISALRTSGHHEFKIVFNYTGCE